VQEQTLLTLGKLGDLGAVHVSDIAQRLHSSDTSVVIAALTALGMLGARASRYSTGVQPLISSTNERVAVAAITAIGQMRAKECEGDLLKGLNSELVQVSCAACTALSCIGQDMRTVTSKISTLLAAQDTAKKRTALQSMALLPVAESMNYGDTICGCLWDDDFSVRSDAVEYFCRHRKETQPLAKLVSAKLSSQDGCQRCAAASVLGFMEEVAAAPAVAKLLSDDFVDVESVKLYGACIAKKPAAALRIAKCAACQALSLLGDAGAEFADTIANIIDATSSWEVRESGLRAIGCMGKSGAKFESRVLDFLNDENTHIASAAIHSLGQIWKTLGGSSEDTVKAVAQKLKHSNPVIRTAAVESLPLAGTAIRPHLESLVKCLDDRCIVVKLAAIAAFPKCGRIGQVYAPLIGGLLVHESSKVRIAALESISCMGDRGVALVDEVAACLEDFDGQVRAAAAAATGKLRGTT
jgi:HEAT repeat protein